MNILLATHNQSKFSRYKRILSSIPDLDVVSLADLGVIDKVEENFSTNTENALHKARSYGKLSGMITIAVDEALMTNFLPDNEQPGVYARRFVKDKRELTDAELVDVWKEIFVLYPQEEKKFIWNFAVAYYDPKTQSSGVECVEELSYVAKYFSRTKTNGYPLSALLSRDKNGIPYIELSQEEKEKKDTLLFSNFIEILRDWFSNNCK